MHLDLTSDTTADAAPRADARAPLRRKDGVRAATRPATALATLPAPVPLRPGQASVLVVEHDARQRRLLQALLLAEGHAVRCAGDGRAALAEVARTPPDLVLLAARLPRMDGYQVAAALRSDPACGHLPVILMLGRMDRSARIAGIQAGASEFITRPVDRDELALRMGNLLRLREHARRAPPPALPAAEAAPEGELQRFRSAMDATVDAIFLISRTTMRFVEVNQTACQLLGYTRQQLFDAGPVRLWPGTTHRLEDAFDAIIAAHGDTGPTDTRMRHKHGHLVDVEIHQKAQRYGDDWFIVGMVRDITRRKETENTLHRLAHYDALTGLPNRALFYDTLARTLAQASANGWQVAVMFIDLDNFKSVNDTLGHAIGDELLSQLANRLVKCVRTRDVIGRLGGDEFALILVMNDCRNGAAIVAAKVRESLRAPFYLMGHDLSVTASIGITIHPEDTRDPATLLKYADMAMYRAKQAGRDATRFFTPQMNVEMNARMALEKALRAAVENQEFVLHYQPKLSLADGRTTGLEALLRWQRPGHGLVSPQDFVPVLEETGLIVRVGRWVIDTACRQIGRWLQSSVGRMQIAVNISSRQFTDSDLVEDVSSALARSGIPPELLELELTEGSLMDNTDRTVQTLTRLKALGTELTIDDFGTGYSSLAYLRRFPIDKLKIDIAFIRDITRSDDDATIALAIINMAHSLRLTVIAEGVETSEQVAYLRRHRCDQIQGFCFSKPLSAPAMEWMLLDRAPWDPPDLAPGWQLDGGAPDPTQG
ncbi:putative bifunctional diguanylate cyclase/phosphodiesterase [Arenimonas sp. MALMAid1274]|uniref:putative bifunctional diguanylate cyclase/phosphodiesterase n=1 Tax=Arenimonas sp. MALMAid1274 TaxID=3411630 RepID=UPI003BA3C67E